LPAFFNLERFMRDVIEITDSGRGPEVTQALVMLSALRNFDPQKAPAAFGPRHFRALLEDCFFRVSGNGDHWSNDAYSYRGRWKLLILNPVWFQDAYNYDFWTVLNASTPVATQQGEISFSAYNGGGWRKIVEHLHQAGSLAKWNKANGRHAIYTKGKKIELEQPARRPQAPLVQIESEPMPVAHVVLESYDCQAPGERQIPS
jgi:hypothetical protein